MLRILLSVAIIFICVTGIFGESLYYGFIRAGLEYDNTIDEVENLFFGNIDIRQNLRVSLDLVSGFASLSAGYRQDVPTVTLDKAYVLFHNEWLLFEIGKDRLTEGVGYIWNPADILNPGKSPLYHDEERRGSEEGILLSTVSLFGFMDILSYQVKGIIIPNEDLELTKGVSELKVQFLTIEAAFLAGFQKDENNIYAGYLRAPVPGLDFITLYSEFRIINFNSHSRLLAGLQVIFPFDIFGGTLQLQGEYYRNEDGYDDMESYFMDNPGTIPVLSETLKNYLYTGLAFFNLDLNLVLGIIFNLDEDRSGLINFSVMYKLFDDTRISIGGFFPVFSDETDEFISLTRTRFQIYLSLDIFYSISENKN